MPERTYKLKDVMFGETAVLVVENKKGYVFIFPNQILQFIVEQFKKESHLMRGIYLRDYYHSLTHSQIPLPVYRFDCLI